MQAKVLLDTLADAIICQLLSLPKWRLCWDLGCLSNGRHAPFGPPGSLFCSEDTRYTLMFSYVFSMFLAAKQPLGGTSELVPQQALCTTPFSHTCRRHVALLSHVFYLFVSTISAPTCHEGTSSGGTQQVAFPFRHGTCNKRNSKYKHASIAQIAYPPTEKPVSRLFFLLA
jgi:hypothetical protein